MRIVFYDGYCPMCNSWVKQIVRRDKHKTFQFAPLDSETARKMLTSLVPDYIKEDTIIYYEDGKVFMRSDAALRILKTLGFPVSMLSMGLLVPKTIRDGVYNWVAKRRYKFGKRYEECPLPPLEWRDRFLAN